MRYTSARQVWHDCYTLAEKTPGGRDFKLLDPTHKRLDFFTQKAARTITAQATAPKKGSRSIEIPESFELIKAHQIIKKMPALLRAWGMYAYTYQHTTSQYHQVVDAVFGWWHEENEFEFKSSALKSARHVALCEKALEDMKVRLCTNGRSKHTPAEYCHVMGLQQSNWARDGWEMGLSRIHNYIDQLDRRALAPIAKMLNEREILEDEV